LRGFRLKKPEEIPVVSGKNLKECLCSGHQYYLLAVPLAFGVTPAISDRPLYEMVTSLMNFAEDTGINLSLLPIENGTLPDGAHIKSVFLNYYVDPEEAAIIREQRELLLASTDGTVPIVIHPRGFVPVERKVDEVDH
jgi:hypothetical protein